MLKEEPRPYLTKIFIYDDLLDPSTKEHSEILGELKDKIATGFYLSGTIFMTEENGIYVTYLRHFSRGIKGGLVIVKDDTFEKINKLYTDKGFVPRVYDDYIFYSLSEALRSDKDIMLEEVDDWLGHKEYLKDIKNNPGSTQQVSIDVLKPDLSDPLVAEMLEDGLTLNQAKNHLERNSKNNALNLYGRPISIKLENPRTGTRSVKSPHTNTLSGVADYYKAVVDQYRMENVRLYPEGAKESYISGVSPIVEEAERVPEDEGGEVGQYTLPGNEVFKVNPES